MALKLLQGRDKSTAGRGLANLKAAYALQTWPGNALVITSSRILSRCWIKGAAIIAAYLTEKGLKMIFQNDVAEIHGNGSGVTGVTLANGQELEANLIVIGKGVRPFTPFLRGSGVTEKYGVVVDEQLQTNLPGIYAAGDATLCRDMLLDEPANNALWPNATAQGEIAGANMSGDRLTYRGSMKMNARIFGLPVMPQGWAGCRAAQIIPGRSIRCSIPCVPGRNRAI